jgi:hypothetical protein
VSKTRDGKRNGEKRKGERKERKERASNGTVTSSPP